MDYGGGDHKSADFGYVGLYCYRQKSVTAGMDSGLGCTPTLPVTTAPLRRHMRQMWCYISEPDICLLPISQIRGSGTVIAITN